MEKIIVKQKASFEAYIVDQQRSVGMEHARVAQPEDYLLVGTDGTLHHFPKESFEQMFEVVEEDSSDAPASPESAKDAEKQNAGTGLAVPPSATPDGQDGQPVGNSAPVQAGETNSNKQL